MLDFFRRKPVVPLNNELARINSLSKSEGLKQIYGLGRESFNNGDFSKISDIFNTTELKKLDTDIILAILIISKWRPEQFEWRPAFVEAARILIKKRGHWEHGILDGID